MSSPPRRRLDQHLVALGLAASRSRAWELIHEGHVRVDGLTVKKPAHLVSEACEVTLARSAWDYVSRGALKLKAALEHFEIDPRGWVALDVGASTGGFTEVLLEAGVVRVYAVDVGRNQLHARLRDDPRVVVLEGVDARALTAAFVPEPIALVVADVSFISLTKALAAPLARAGPEAWLIALVKPQFELGPKAVGKGGVVRDARARQAACERVCHWLETKARWRVAGLIPSPIPGRSGNLEYLLAARANSFPSPDDRPTLTGEGSLGRVDGA